MDQAARLRELARRGRNRSFAVLSGKGGVGKTNLSLALALTAQQAGYSTVLWDADFGLGNCDVLLDVSPRGTSLDVLCGNWSLDDALTPCAGGLTLLAAPSGVHDNLWKNQEGRLKAKRLFEELGRRYEVVVVDAPAGVGDVVVSVGLWADTVLLATSPEVPAVADAYATVKVIAHAGRRSGIGLVVNLAAAPGEAEKIGARIAHVAERFVGARVSLLGWIPADSHVPLAVSRRRPFTLAFPECPASLAVRRLWERIAEQSPVGSAALSK